MKTMTLIGAVGLLLLGACKEDDEPPTPLNNARDIMNVAYGDHPRQRMDVHFPQGYTTATPVAFVIHGGGFVAGSKEQFAIQARMMRDQGFVTVNLSHRLVDTTGIFRYPPLRQASEVTIADQLDDVGRAVAKFRAEATGWEAGTDRVYMAGHSAGAILAMLYTQGDRNKDGFIRASGNWAGITDFSIPNDSAFAGIPQPGRSQLYELYWRMSGAEPRVANNLAYMAVSPYWVANLHGGRPNISIFPQYNVIFGGAGEVDYNKSTTTSFHKLLRDKGIPERMSVFAGSDHGFSTPPDAWLRCIRETAEFFKAN
jgi:acetyl esterase/lipase